MKGLKELEFTFTNEIVTSVLVTWKDTANRMINIDDQQSLVDCLLQIKAEMMEKPLPLYENATTDEELDTNANEEGKKLDTDANAENLIYSELDSINVDSCDVEFVANIKENIKNFFAEPNQSEKTLILNRLNTAINLCAPFGEDYKLMNIKEKIEKLPILKGNEQNQSVDTLID
jgi:uncharacterized protein (DUF2252 family)